MPRFLVPALAFALGLLGLCVALFLALPGGGVRTAASVGGPFSLVAQDGRRVSDSDFKGMPVLVFFGYTHCPDVCPSTLSDLSLVLAKLPPGAKFGAVFITVDPERDTPAALKDYMSSFDPRILALSGARAELEPVWKAYRVFARKIPGKDGDYAMDHTALVYLMDRTGEFAGSFNLSQSPADAARAFKKAL